MQAVQVAEEEKEGGREGRRRGGGGILAAVEPGELAAGVEQYGGELRRQPGRTCEGD